MPWLINAAQVDKFRKSQKSLIILDASLHMPATMRNAQKEFEDKHIVGANFFDIDAFSDPNTDTPHMLIQNEQIISEKLGAMGIRNDYKIIFYDNSDLHSACRALWMMKVFGHNPHLLYVLDGGLTAWEKYIGKTESGNPTVTARPYKAKLQLQHLRTLSQMKNNLHEPTELVIDLRHPVRFSGGKEPRPGMRVGHIPGSMNFPFTAFFDKNNGTFLPPDKIRKTFASVGIDIKAPVIATCGSGITAPILDFTLDILGHPQHSVYDGSWSEWGADKLYAGENSLDERPVKTCVEFDEPPKID
jgi:thiosulfate/3-mercaptopyruvate sulfurtransferase